MKKFNSWFFYLVALWIVSVIGYRGLGGFLNLHVLEKKVGPYTIVYSPFSGKLMNVHETIDVIQEVLSDENIHRLGSASMFKFTYTGDKATKVGEYGGVRIDPKDAEKLDKKSSIYKIKEVSNAKKPVIIFPYKAGFSCVVGHLRSTPKLNKYLISKGYANATILEIFDKENSTVSYIAETQK